MPATGDKLRRRILVIASPIIFQNLFQYTQVFVDSMLLGHKKSAYLTAIGNLSAPFFTTLSFLFAASAGITVLVAHAVGARQWSRAERFGEVSLFYHGAAGVLLWLVWLLGAGQVLQVMGAKGEILQYGTWYLQYLSWSMLFLGGEIAIMALLQGVGLTRPIMTIGILRNVINVVLDLILINGYLGFPAMEIRGAALATTISNGIAFLLFVRYLFGRHIPFTIRLAGIFRPRWRVFRRVLHVGLPAGLEFMLYQVGQLVVVRLLNVLDQSAVGVYFVVRRLQIFSLYVYQGFARAAMTLVGQHIGAGDHGEARRAGLASNRFSLLVSLVISLVFVLFPRQCQSLFTSDPDFLARGIPLMYLAALTMFPQTVNVVIGSSIRGMKDTRWMLYTQIGGTLFTVGTGTISIFVLGGGLVAMFMIFLADELARAVINYLRFYRSIGSYNNGNVKGL